MDVLFDKFIPMVESSLNQKYMTKETNSTKYEQLSMILTITITQIRCELDYKYMQRSKTIKTQIMTKWEETKRNTFNN